MDVKDILLAPFRAFSLGARIGLRIAVGIAGFLLMGGGLFLMDVGGLWVIGLPLFVLGLLATLKAIF